MRGAAHNAFVQLAADSVRLGVVDESVRIGQLLAANQRQSVQRAFRRIGGLQHLEVESGNLPAQGDAGRVVAACSAERPRATGPVKGLLAFALDANM